MLRSLTTIMRYVGAASVVQAHFTQGCLETHRCSDVPLLGGESCRSHALAVQEGMKVRQMALDLALDALMEWLECAHKQSHWCTGNASVWVTHVMRALSRQLCHINGSVHGCYFASMRNPLHAQPPRDAA